MKKEILSVIPAKGHSKGLSNKNLYPFCGKALVEWAIEASLQSQFITRTVVSSDSREIIDLSKKLGANIIKRPSQLATSVASCENVMMHAVNYLRETEGYTPDVLILLQPTSPLRTYEDIDAAIELFFNKNCSAVISGYELQRNPLKEFLIDEEGKLTAIIDNSYPFRPRQQLPPAFRPNGAIYIVKAELFRQTHCLLTDNTKPFFMNKQKSIDIDTLDDLNAAAKFYEQSTLRSRDNL
jgi:CMP-N-acetylneuraminic acid synthetase